MSNNGSKKENSQLGYLENYLKKKRNGGDTAILESLISGSLSSALTSVIYQPLELLKTRIQIQHDNSCQSSSQRILGRTIKSASSIIKEHGVTYLWRGTGASLVRSVPGVGLYYALLNILQTNFSSQTDRPNNAAQAFYFGLTARSMVSSILLPVTVIKVRYESGLYRYSSLQEAIGGAYLRNGWVGMAPTILRDSLFSGVYYMCYTKLKTLQDNSNQSNHVNFLNGLCSGLIASLITNPMDVVKTKIQACPTSKTSMREIVMDILQKEQGYLRFFDGLVPRSVRRALIAATTWTLYEFITSTSKQIA